MRSMQWQLGILGTISAFAYRHKETKKNMCRGGRWQDLPSTDFQPALTFIKNKISFFHVRFMLLQRPEIFASLSLGPFSVWKVYFASFLQTYFHYTRTQKNSVLSSLASLFSFILTIVSVCLIFSEILFIFSLYSVAQLVKALRYKSEGRGFSSQWCHWSFSLTFH